MLNPDNKSYEILETNEKSLKNQYDKYIEQIETLQQNLEKEKDKRKEEHFWCASLFLLILDGYVFKNISWLPEILIILLQLAILFYYAERCGVEQIVKLFFKIFNYVQPYISRLKEIKEE